METLFGAMSIILLCSAAACGNQDAPVTDTRLPDMTADGALPAPSAESVSATSREDVAQALRCHDVISSAMASNVVQGNGSAAAGVREQIRWFSEAQRRAEAAGLTNTEFNELAAATSLPMSTEEQRAENTPVLNECLANVPDL
jgi:hypothetical protein